MRKLDFPGRTMLKGLALDSAIVAQRVRGRLTSVLAGLMLAGCSVSSPNLPAPETTGALPAAKSSNETATRTGKAKVAMLLPLSDPGQLGALAKSMKQAGEMALFDRSSPHFELIVKDDRGTPEGARTAAQEAIGEGVDLIIGPLLSASVEAVTPIAATARVPVLAFSNDRRLTRPGVYLLSFMPDQDVKRVVSYALANGRRNFAALLPDDAYGQIVEVAFKDMVGAAQGNIVAIERYSRGGAGTLEATRKLGEALTGAGSDGSTVADALLLPGEPETLIGIGPLIAYARIDTTRVKLLGSGGWDSPNLGRDPTFVGGWFPAPDQRGWQSFSEKFTTSFGTAPPRLASLAYDAVGISLALSGAPAAERFTTAGFSRTQGFSGSDGPIRFHADGSAQRSLAIYEVQAFGARLLEAPAAGQQSTGVAPVAAPGGPRAANRAVQLN